MGYGSGRGSGAGEQRNGWDGLGSQKGGQVRHEPASSCFSASLYSLGHLVSPPGRTEQDMTPSPGATPAGHAAGKGRWMWMGGEEGADRPVLPGMREEEEEERNHGRHHHPTSPPDGGQ